MKKWTWLLLLVALKASPQQCRTAWGLSINSNVGIGAEIALLAQDKRVGYASGLVISTSLSRQMTIQMIDGKEVRSYNTQRIPSFIVFSEGLFTMVRRDYRYSLKAVTGILYDTERSMAAYGGINLFIPIGTRAIFTQCTYRTDGVVMAKGGVYFPF